MNYKKLWLIPLGIVLFLASCIKDEARNMEADITSVEIAEELINAKPIINNRNVVIYIKPGAMDITHFPLEFSLTPGATVSPASGSEQDFSEPVVYEVTSEDGQFKKEYSVSLIEASVPEDFNFELYDFDAKKNWVYFYEEVVGVKQNLWASGNAGFAFTAGVNPASTKYPTQVTEDPQYVHEGKSAAYMETKSTGAFGAMFKMPIAAGNLFVGSMNVDNILSPETRFGLPFNKIPATLEGYYRYIPGEKIIDKDGKVVPGIDECDIYAVFYDRIALWKETWEDPAQPDRTWLNNDDILTSPHIVAIAQLAEGKATAGSDFVKFSIPFEMKKQVLRSDVDAFKYNIAIVFSSSKNGAIFQGAVGSKLIVDQVKVTVK